MKDYREFLETKIIVYEASGIEVSKDDIHSMLFDFQRDLTYWAIRKGKCAIFADTGLGKTIMQLEWARLISKHRALIVAPLSVARQTVREGEKLGIKVHYTRSGSDLIDSINITNYEMIDRFDPENFDAIVLDECLVGDTLIDTKEGTKRIADIEIGDEIYSAVGLQKVRAKTIRYKKSLVLTSIQGRDIISSENHPFLTCKGWIKAKDLKRGDHIVHTTEAMRVVRETLDGNTDKERESFLQSILFSKLQ